MRACLGNLALDVGMFGPQARYRDAPNEQDRTVPDGVDQVINVETPFMRHIGCVNST